MSDDKPIKLGKYGTSFFKGGDRFKSTTPRSASVDVDVPPPKGIADLVKEKKGGGWVKSTTPRFASTKPPPSANAEIYVPPGIGDTPSNSPNRGSYMFRASADRFSDFGGSQRRSRSAEPASGGSASVYVPPGIADTILRSKRGCSYFKGKERFGREQKSYTEKADFYDVPGLAEEMRRSRRNPMKASGTRFQESKDAKKKQGSDWVYVPPPMGCPKKPGKCTFGTGDRFSFAKPTVSANAEHTDPTYGTIAGNVEKVKGKGGWQRSTTPRLGAEPRSASPNAEMYIPKPFGSDVRAPAFAKYSGKRFQDEKKGGMNAPYYDPPSFVDLILRK